jgi:hypothetical protein
MFFGNQYSEKVLSEKPNQQQPVPRCHSCRVYGHVSHAGFSFFCRLLRDLTDIAQVMPPADSAPDGTEVRELAPCGHDFAVCWPVGYSELSQTLYR